MIIFDGYKLAASKEIELKVKVQKLGEESRQIKIAAILFSEDAGSVLYSNLKKDAAKRVGVVYQLQTFSLKDRVEEVTKLIDSLNTDDTVTGIIIQKPTRSVYQQQASEADFDAWWQGLVSRIALEKDVDGLRPDRTLLPATAKAVLEILDYAQISLNNKKILILNRSDILGQPLYQELKNRGVDATIWGSKELLASKNQCQDFDVIISGTGRPGLITGDMIKKGVVLIDVGEPAGDIDFESVKDKAEFITPVPGGVGPMTVVSLLQNAVDLTKLD